MWDSEEPIAEAGRQPVDATVSIDVVCQEKCLQNFSGTSNKLFRNLRNKGKSYRREIFYN